jgi:hypothetical protein
MATLTIKNFSCVEEASVELSKLTILIGPQASGKSVISKLIYFFYDILIRQFSSTEVQKSLDDFKEDLTDDFKKWFPPSAWGDSNFSITLNAGPVFIKISRAPEKKGGRPNIRLNFSPYLEEFYESLTKAVTTALDTAKKRKEELPADYEVIWRAQRPLRQKFQKEMGRHYVSWQLFIPAGRSFFTSIGKALAVFEYGGLLDPITLQFGRYFANIRDVRHRRFFYREPNREAQETRNKMMRQLFGGNLKFDREQEYLESEDGRKIPFSTLSSGQQELLPLWMALEFVQERELNNIVYIEEPEAHLFPTAQSQLVEYLASIVSDSKNNIQMVLTTHSPYVLSQINVQLKAGLLADEQPDLFGSISKIVQQKNWLPPRSTMAYAIVGKRLKKIMDADGLIDGDYLDEVSGYLAREFNALLAIETSERSNGD